MRQALLLLALGWCAIAQTADSSLTFEVASVKVTGAAESLTLPRAKAPPAPHRQAPIRFSSLAAAPLWRDFSWRHTP
jgi:hypothetical protein